MQYATTFVFPSVNAHTPPAPTKAAVFHSSSITDVSSDRPDYAPDSAYTVAHTISGRRTIHLGRHLARLFDSVSRLEYSTPWSAEQIRGNLCACLEHLQLERSRFRITLRRDGALILSIERYAGLPSKMRQEGVVCATIPHSARGQAATKTTQWIENRKTVVHESAYETLLCGADGTILEGSSSNFFAVQAATSGQSVGPENGDKTQESSIVFTAGEGVLRGITRSLVIELLSEFATIEYNAVTRKALGNIQEAFITSSTRGVLPVKAIDDYQLGRPGNVTVSLMHKYDAWVEAHAQPICDRASLPDNA